MCTMGSCRTGHNHAQFSDLAGVINFGADLADAHMPGTREERIIRLERDILSKNGAFARANRDRLKAAGIFTLNLVSSPGSGKTSLLVRTIADLKHRFPISVIEGDQQTSNQKRRLAGARLETRLSVKILSSYSCNPDKHWLGLSSRRTHGRPRARSPAIEPGQPSLHRECRQSHLPGGCRPR